MKSGDVLKALGITRPTLTKWVKEGKVGIEVKENGKYEYSEDDVNSILNKGVQRSTYIYVNTNRMVYLNSELQCIERVEKYCENMGYTKIKILQDSTKEEKMSRDFEIMVQELMDGRVERIVVHSAENIGKTDFKWLQYMAGKFRCKIETVYDR